MSKKDLLALLLPFRVKVRHRILGSTYVLKGLGYHTNNVTVLREDGEVVDVHIDDIDPILKPLVSIPTHVQDTLDLLREHYNIGLCQDTNT